MAQPTALLTAIKAKDLAEVTALLPLNDWFNHSNKVLKHAVKSGQAAIVQLILNTKRSDLIINQAWRTAIKKNRNDQPEIMRLLLRANANVHGNHDQALRLAIKRRQLATTQLLLEYGANLHINQDEPIRSVTNYVHNFQGAQLHLDLLKLLIKYGANINAGSGWPLQQAILHQQDEAVELLLQAGANTHLIEKQVTDVIQRKNDKLLRLLIDHGLNVHYDNDWFLQRAVILGNLTIIETLLAAGANVNVEIRMEIETGYTSMPRWLRASRIVRENRNPLILKAIETNNLRLAACLLSYGLIVQAYMIDKAKQLGANEMVSLLETNEIVLTKAAR